MTKCPCGNRNLATAGTDLSQAYKKVIYFVYCDKCGECGPERSTLRSAQYGWNMHISLKEFINC